MVINTYSTLKLLDKQLKMNSMKTIILFLAILSLIFVGCKKSETETTKSDLLTQEIWIHNNDMLDTNGNAIADDEKGLQKNISFDFRMDGSLTYTKDQFVTQLSWTFEEDESSVRISGAMDTLSIPVVTESVHSIFQLDDNELIFYVMSSPSYPETGTFKIYKHE